MEGFESLNEERLRNFDLKMLVPKKGYGSLDLCIPWTQFLRLWRCDVAVITAA